MSMKISIMVGRCANLKEICCSKINDIYVPTNLSLYLNRYNFLHNANVPQFVSIFFFYFFFIWRVFCVEQAKFHVPNIRHLMILWKTYWKYFKTF